MPNPIGALEGREGHIGRLVEKVAKTGQEGSDEGDLTSWLVRLDGSKDMTAELKLGEPATKKWVVVPDLDAIEKGFQDLPEDGESYKLRLEYAAQSFPVNLEYLVAQANPENVPDPNERAVILKFLNEVKAPERMKPEDFFYFRLGEYCVSQCY